MNPDFDLRFLKSACRLVGRPMLRLGTHRTLNVAALAWPLVMADGGVNSTGLGAPGVTARPWAS